MPSMAPRDSAISFADVLDLLHYVPDEFVSIGYYVDDGPFHTAVGTSAGAPSYIAGLPADANVFYGINPTTGPARKNSGRGTEDKVTRLAALPLDLDIKPGGCASRDVADAIIAELGILLDSRPSATVDSGYGVHGCLGHQRRRNQRNRSRPCTVEALGTAGRPCRRPATVCTSRCL